MVKQLKTVEFVAYLLEQKNLCPECKLDILAHVFGVNNPPHMSVSKAEEREICESYQRQKDLARANNVIDPLRLY